MDYKKKNILKRQAKRQKESILNKETNDNIKCPFVRLIYGDKNITCSIEEARSIAEEECLDLVLMSKNTNPPVCKLLDYKKFIFEKKKKKREQIKKSKDKDRVKEVKISTNIEENDLSFKLNHIIKFLQDKYQVKITVFPSTRIANFKEVGENIIKKIVDNLEKFGTCQGSPIFDGRRTMYIIIFPK